MMAVREVLGVQAVVIVPAVAKAVAVAIVMVLVTPYAEELVQAVVCNLVEALLVLVKNN
jgi:hypothetical protein